MAKVVFNNGDRVFFNYINEKVEQYFRQEKITKTGDARLYIKTIVLLVTTVAIYCSLLLLGANLLYGLLIYGILGLMQSTIGFNIMHDANHGSFSRRKWVNTTLGLSSNAMGVCSRLWKLKHNVIHHTYTNIHGMDHDIEKSPFLRLCPTQVHKKHHRYQHIYCVLLYGFSSLFMIITDFIKYFSRKILSTSIGRMSGADHFIFWFSKLLYIVLFLLIPCKIIGFLPAITGFLVMHFVLGVILAVVFQLAHVVELTHFAELQMQTLKIEEEWACHQIRTTADFATSNKIISWLTGGLNFQVEHHLFPRISHVHYPAIHQLIKDACSRFSIEFNCYPTMIEAVSSHFRYMKRLGRP